MATVTVGRNVYRTAKNAKDAKNDGLQATGYRLQATGTSPFVISPFSPSAIFAVFAVRI